MEGEKTSQGGEGVCLPLSRVSQKSLIWNARKVEEKENVLTSKINDKFDLLSVREKGRDPSGEDFSLVNIEFDQALAHSYITKSIWEKVFGHLLRKLP